MTLDLCEAFHRNTDGSWTCTRQSVLSVGGGQSVTIKVEQTVRPGELFGDYDLVAYLERVCARNASGE
jgi:hypothetical protein